MGLHEQVHSDIFEREDLQLLDLDLDLIYEEHQQQTWQLAAESFADEQEKAKAETARFLGVVAIRGEAMSRAETASEEQTLMTAIQSAAEGDISAANVIRNNVATDVAERLFKAAHQTRVSMRIIDGKLQQEGRLLTNIHRNTLEHTLLSEEMLRRSKYELHNAHLFEQLHTAGALEMYDAVVFSPASTSMSLEEKKKYHFFVDTETCSIQRLSADGNEVVLESAFVAGKRTPDSERHDVVAIQKMAARRGIELAETDGTELIQHVFLIPKEELHGIEDVVEWYDKAAGGTFYGQEEPAQDYREYAKVCEDRVNSFSGIVDKISAQLMREAAAFASPVEAIMRLDELSERYCVKEAVKDSSLDAAVFGETAAAHIHDARERMAMGDFLGAEQSLQKAQDTAVSGSCPLAKERATGDGAVDDVNNSSKGDTSQEKWMNCPYCKAKVFADPCATRLSCWDCTAMVVNGKIISKGNGGSRARRATKSYDYHHGSGDNLTSISG